MRYTAVAVAAALMFAIVAPAFAQPFADVPTNHWAYDAIAELAAKGLVEGYPDGTFKGDRAMTRYEMAMVVARLLARIESIQIPAPQPPQVTAADLANIQRLVNEFRAELAALGVRVTAIEEELNAIKARLDNVRITGRFRFRYDVDVNPTCGAPIAGNGNAATCSNDSGTAPFTPRAREGLKLVFDGSVAPNVHAIIGLTAENGITSTPITFNGANIGGCNNGGGAASANCTPNYNLGNIAEGYFDWSNAWGLPLRIQLGRMGYAVMPFGGLPLQFGPYGLLLNTNSDTYGASVGNTDLHTVDGIRISGSLPVADLNWQAAAWRVTGPNGGGSYFLGEDAYGVDVNFRIIQGLRLGGYGVWNTMNASDTQVPSGLINSLYHAYGNPSTPLSNPVTARCPVYAGGTLPLSSGGGASQAGIQCPAQGNGYGAYLDWDILPGLHFDVEAAQWNDGTAGGGSDNAYWGGLTIDLGAMTGVGHHFTLTLSYESAGTNFYAPYQADVDSNIIGSVGPGNAQLFYAGASADITDAWNIYAGFYTGNQVSNGQGIQEYALGVIYRFAPNAQLNTYVNVQKLNGITQSPETFYRSQLDYTF
jgi:S-layer homology domain